MLVVTIKTFTTISRFSFFGITVFLSLYNLSHKKAYLKLKIKIVSNTKLNFPVKWVVEELTVKEDFKLL